MTTAAALFLPEFPDYPGADMPPVPVGMRDASWHNDACPSFIGLGVQVFLDYPDREQREFPDSKRFIVSADPERYDHNEVLFESDDWSATLHFIANHDRTLAQAIGLHFVWVLHNDMAPEDFAKMCRRNATEDNPAICHSHDFIDANLAMEAAFRHHGVHGEDPVKLFTPDGQMSVDATTLWNAAWEAAMPYIRSTDEITVDIMWTDGRTERRHFRVRPGIIDCGGETFPGIDYADEDDVGQTIAYGIDDGGFWADDLQGDNDEVIAHWRIVTRPDTAMAAMPTLHRTRHSFDSTPSSSQPPTP